MFVFFCGLFGNFLILFWLWKATCTHPYGRRKHEREWGRPSQGSKQQWKLTHNNCHHQGYNPCGFQTTDFSSDVCFHHLTPLEWAQTTEISMAIVAAGRCRLFERRRVTRTHTHRGERDFKGLSQTIKREILCTYSIIPLYVICYLSFVVQVLFNCGTLIYLQYLMMWCVHDVS